MPTVVFLSSTFVDLAEHRSQVTGAIRELRHEASAMELFGSRPDSPKEECLGLVRKSNIFISILGMRHGSVDQSTGKSITELEYEEAIALKLPCLIYLMDEDEHLVPPRSVEQGEGSEKLRKLKNLLRQRHVISKFSSASDLAAKVAKDLVQTVGAREQAPTATVLVS